jgi:hypothetical protein
MELLLSECCTAGSAMRCVGPGCGGARMLMHPTPPKRQEMLMLGWPSM